MATVLNNLEKFDNKFTNKIIALENQFMDKDSRLSQVESKMKTYQPGRMNK